MTRFFRNVVSAAALAIMVIVPLSPAGATDVGNQPESARVTLRATGANWQTDFEFESAVLTVSGPDDVVLRKEFTASEALELNLADAASSGLPDGQYAWELRFSPRMSKEQKDRLRAARESGDDAAITELKSKGKMPIEVAPSSGYFRVSGGNVVVAERTEMPPRRVSPQTEGDAQPGVVNDQDAAVATKDQVILDDLIVDGSGCFGFDCVNGESFGFDTLRLKENNLRIKFQDTSNSASFPTNDWQLTANDTSNGGANKFSIDDIDGGRTPFTIRAGAPSNSLYVDASGRVGFGTATPATSLHAANGNTPTLRLEQNGSSGFTAQTWDVAGNEANFFIRDATNGSTLPFRIFPGAPSNAITIEASGDVGLGTNSPSASLHVQESTGSLANLMTLSNNSGVQFLLENTAAGASPWNLAVFGNSFVISRPGSGGSEFEITNGGTFRFRNGGTLLMEISNTGDVNSASGVFGSLSDRNAKNNLLPVNGADVLGRIASLPILEWSYSHQPDSVRHIGPMAQDFFNAFGLFGSNKMIAMTDLASVALAGVKELNETMIRKNGELADLRAENAALASRLEAIQNENTALKGRLDRIESLLLSPDGNE